MRWTDPSGLQCLHKPCTDLLPKFKTLPRNLAECLIKAGTDKGKITDCVKDYGSSLWDDLVKYLACVAPSPTGPPSDHDLDPCNPPNDQLCMDCCYEQYLVQLVGCEKRYREFFGDCFTALA